MDDLFGISKDFRMNSPCSDTAIGQLQESLEFELPSGYVEFIRHPPNLA